MNTGSENCCHNNMKITQLKKITQYMEDTQISLFPCKCPLIRLFEHRTEKSIFPQQFLKIYHQ